MLSSTSLLHGNCIFNRNNTVATQQGMKTYWLCKSYRITMCRARCITHLGRVISSTGCHNHQPHMKGPYPNMEFFQSGNGNTVPSNSGSLSIRLPPVIPSSTPGTQSQGSPPQQANTVSTASLHHETPQHQLTNEVQSHEPNHTISATVHHSPSTSQHHSHISHTITSSTPQHNSSLQNMMHNVLSHNNLMHLSNITPILNPMQNQHLTHLNSPHLSNELHISPSQGGENNQCMHSPNSPQSGHHSHAQIVRSHMPDVNQISEHHQSATMHAHHQHQQTQGNVNNSPIEISSTLEATPQQSTESESIIHHSMGNNLNNSSNYKLEQI